MRKTNKKVVVWGKLSPEMVMTVSIPAGVGNRHESMNAIGRGKNAMTQEDGTLVWEPSVSFTLKDPERT